MKVERKGWIISALPLPPLAQTPLYYENIFFYQSTVLRIPPIIMLKKYLPSSVFEVLKEYVLAFDCFLRVGRVGARFFCSHFKANIMSIFVEQVEGERANPALPLPPPPPIERQCKT